MAELRTVRKTARIVTPKEYSREFGIKSWTSIEPTRPEDYCSVVLWLLDGEWVHKGWLMPEATFHD